MIRVSKGTITAVSVPMEDFSRREEHYHVGHRGDRKRVLVDTGPREPDKGGTMGLLRAQETALGTGVGGVVKWASRA